MTDLPVACTLGPESLKARREGLLNQLVSRAQQCEERADGYALHFDAADDVLPLIGRTIDAERRCCRFLRFHLTVEPDSGPIRLELTGPAGTREFLSALLSA